MSSTTTNLGLTKPAYTDDADVAIINSNMDIIDTAYGSINQSTLRDVPFAVAVSDWSAVTGGFSATFNTAYITASSKEILTYDGSLASYAKAHIIATKKSGGGGITFTTATKPTGTITGNAYVFDNDDNKLPVLIEDTVTPIANGGTGQSSLAGAQQALGITALNNQMSNLVKINKQPFSDVAIGSDGNISFSFSGHSVIAIVHDKGYYTCAPWKDAYNYWHGKLTSASNDSHPSSGTVSGTIYYVD